MGTKSNLHLLWNVALITAFICLTHLSASTFLGFYYLLYFLRWRLGYFYRENSCNTNGYQKRGHKTSPVEVSFNKYGGYHVKSFGILILFLSICLLYGRETTNQMSLFFAAPIPIFSCEVTHKNHWVAHDF